MKCLIVVDDPVSSRSLQKMISLYGTSDVVDNGKETVDLFLHALENNNSYDLIIMDVMMPEMDEYQTVRIIREKEEFLNIPLKRRVKVIKTISMNYISTIIKAFYGSYADSYLIKPISVRRLVFELYRLNLIQKSI